MSPEPTSPRSPFRALSILLALLFVVGVTACGGSGGDDDEGSTSATSGATSFTLWAPTDIQVPVEKVIKAYNQRFPEVQITTVFETQPDLNDRLLVGERPDLYIGTGPQVNSLGDDGTLPKDTRVFGTDAIVIAVPPGNPKGIADYTSFALDPLTRTGVCKPDTSCGRAARTILTELNIVPAPDASEENAKTLIEQVAANNLDAAIVYRSDVVKAVRDGKVDIVRVTAGNRGTTEYRIVIVHEGEAVTSFLRYLQRSSQVKKILQNYGLLPLGLAAAEGEPTDQPAEQPAEQPN